MQQRCNGCGIEVIRFHLDHIVPKSRGGTETPRNFQILCQKCNLSKGALTMEEWVRVPNARCRNYWWWRVAQAPKGDYDKFLDKTITTKTYYRISKLSFISDLTNTENILSYPDDFVRFFLCREPTTASEYDLSILAAVSTYMTQPSEWKPYSKKQLDTKLLNDARKFRDLPRLLK